MNSKAISELLRRELRLRIETGQASARNLQSALNKLHKLEGDDAPAKLLDARTTDGLIDSVTESLKSQPQPASQSTIYSIRANLNKLAVLARELCISEQPEEADQKSAPTKLTIEIENHEAMSLGDLVKEAVRQNYETSPKAQGRRARMSRGTVYIQALALRDIERRTNGAITESWLEHMMRANKTPRHGMRDRLALLEQVLRLEEGVLSSRAKVAKKVTNVKYNRAPRTEILDELPPQVQRQWDALVEFHTSGDTPATVAPSFANDHAISVKLRGAGTWKVKSDDQGQPYCQTGSNYERQVRAYLSWLHCDHGIPVEELDLSLLCHDKLLEQYKRYKRASGITSAERMAILICKLLKEQYSYLSRYHAPTKAVSHSSDMIAAQYPNGLPVYTTSEEWALARAVIYANCLEVQRDCTTLRKAQRSSGDLASVGSTSNVTWVLNDPRGVVGATDDHVWKMINLLSDWSLKDGTPDIDRIVYGRAAAFYAMELVRPIRMTNAACIMILDKPCSNTTKLKWESVWLTKDGDYRFFIPEVRMKNESGSEVESVDFTVYKGSRPHKVIKRWLSTRAKVLKENGVQSEWFLIKSKGEKLGQSMWRINEKTSKPEVVGGASIKDSSYRALQAIFTPEELVERDIMQGINPHAMRHIVAHYIIEKTTGDYALAAHALMDSVDTIIKTYGKNNHKVQSRKLEEMWREAG